MDGSISLRELVDVDIIQAIQDSFAKTVGVSSVIFLPDGDALTRFSNPTEFCSLIQSTKEGRRRCFQSFTEMSRKAAELSEPEIMYCFAYGAHFVAPIIIGGERKATMYAGQFRPEKFSPEQLKELEKIALEIDLDPELLAREATNMRMVGEDVVWDCLHSFFRAVKAIAELGAQALELRQTKDTLQKAHDELEMRVQERTTELTETNKELRQEIVERRAAEDALHGSEQNFRDLVENMLDGVAIADENAYHIYVNPKFSEITGYSRDELLNMTGWDFTRPEDRLKLKQRMEDRMVGKPSRTHYDRIIVRKDGTEVPVEMSTTVTTWQGTKRPMAILHDITERKQAEDALRGSEEKLRSIVEQSDDGIVLVNEEGAIIEWNPGQERITGLSRAKVLGRPLWAAMFQVAATEHENPALYEQIKASVLKILATGQSERLEETVIKRPDGARRVIQAAVFPIETDKGFMAGSISRDITERKQAEDSLHIERNNLINILESMNDGVYIVNQQYDIQYANPVLKKDFGLYDGRKCYKYFHDRDNACPWCKNRDVLAGKTVRWEWYSSRNQRTYDLVDTPLKNPDGSISKLEIFRDITERKNAEDALRGSEEKLRSIVEQSDDGIVLADEQGTIIEWNPGQERITGLSRAEVLGGLMWDVQFRMATTDRATSAAYERVKAGVLEFLKTGQSERLGKLQETVIKRPDGSHRVIQVAVFPIKTDEGFMAGSISRDITKRKKAEEELRESEKKYNRLFSEMVDGFALHEIICDGDGKPIDYVTLEVNKSYEKMLGVKKEDVVGVKTSQFMTAKELNWWLELFGPTALTGKSTYYEKYSQLNDEYFEGVIYCPKKNQFAVTFANITERKKAEVELRLHAAMMDNVAEGVYLIGLDDLLIKWTNEKFARMFGYDPGEMVGKQVDIVNAPTEKTPAETRISIVDILKETGEWHGEVRNVKRDGTRFWCYANVSLFDHPEYGAVIVSVHTDITKRKQAEKALRESEARFKSIFSDAPVGIEYYDSEGDLIDVNQECMNIFGVDDKEEIKGFKLFEDPNLSDESKRQVKEGKPYKYETEFDFELVKKHKLYKTSKSGKCFLNILITPYEIPELNEIGYLVHVEDIAERKQAEQYHQEAEAELKHIIRVVPGIIVKVNAHTGYFTYCNQALSDILGFAPEEFLARPFIEFVHPDDRQSTIYEVEKQLKGSPLAMFENRYICKNGSYKWLEWRATAADEKEVIYAAATDITERKAAEEQIKRSLREKDVLMHEMHHRVKNNLQVASSLLSMQARTTPNKEAIDVLSKSQSRINTMALIHTQLYESGDLSELNMEEFVGTLSEELFRSYPVTDTKIAHIIRMTDHKFPISVGMYVGLIINELLSNAIEHAFGEREEGTIEVSLTASDSGRVNLRVSDDGIGLPPGFDIDKTRSLGLHLVKILVEDQLQGKLEITSDGGATFNMEFDI